MTRPTHKDVEKENVGKRRVNLRPSQWEAIRQLAFHDDTTKSHQIRRAVDHYIRWRSRPNGRRRKAAVKP